MKPNLILLHGALGSKRYFEKLKSELDIYFNVYDLDFVGHGEREIGDGVFSISRFADNVMELMIEEGIEQTNLFGYSMGGYVALDAASRMPEKFDRIITYGTKFNWTLESAEKEIKLLNPTKIEEKVPAFAKRLAAYHSPNDWKENMRLTADLMRDLGNGMGLNERQFDLIQHKVTIGWGSADKMVTDSESKNAVELLAQGKFERLEDQPHAIEQVDLDVLINYIITNLK